MPLNQHIDMELLFCVVVLFFVIIYGGFVGDTPRVGWMDIEQESLKPGILNVKHELQIIGLFPGLAAIV